MKPMVFLKRAKHIWNPKIVILEKLKGFKGPSILEWPTNNYTSPVESTTPINNKLFAWLNIYENLIGLSEVKNAQSNVINAERDFLNALNVRKARSREIEEVQREIRDIRDQLETTTRGQDKYLDLVTREHQALRKEGSLSRVFKDAEEEERMTFQKLSSAVRESHEKERVQSEKTKYLSLAGSLLGILIGVLASGINNRLKMSQLKALIAEGGSNQTVERVESVERFNGSQGINLLILSELTQALERERSRIESFLADLKILLALDLPRGFSSPKSGPTLPDNSYGAPTLWKQIYDTMTLNEVENGAGVNENDKAVPSAKTEPSAVAKPEPLDLTGGPEGLFTAKSALLLDAMKEREGTLERDLQEVKAALALKEDRVQLTFVDKDQLAELLSSNQRDLEWKLKMNSLATTVILYACVAITLPIIYSLSKGA